MKETKISDAFLFFNEDSICLLRLHYLHTIVDSFVIIEGTHSFTGKRREPCFQNKVLTKLMGFPEIVKKIRYRVVDLAQFEGLNSPWEVESFLRNSIALNLDPDTNITICSDCDEIPSVKWITDIKSTGLEDDLPAPSESEHEPASATIYAPNMLMFYGNMQNLMFDASFKPVQWNGVFAASNNLLNQFSPDVLRSLIRSKDLADGEPLSLNQQSILVQLGDRGGWHLSYFGSNDQTKEKIGSFSHQEFSIQAHANTVYASTNNGQDPFMRDYHFRLPMPEQLFPAPTQQDLAAAINYPKFTYDYWQTACLQRVLENSNSQMLTEQAKSRAVLDQARAEAELARAEIEALQTQLKEMESNHHRLQYEFNQVTQSTSWRLTSKPRQLMDHFRSLLNASAKQPNRHRHELSSQRQATDSSFVMNQYSNSLNKPLPVTRKLLRWAYQKMPLPIATKRSIWTRLMLVKGHLNGASRIAIPRAEDIPSITIEEQLAIIASLRFPWPTAEPEISIIIPCYNQIHYTLSCLTSIRDNPPSVDYEVIIINDASANDDYHLLDEVDGLTVIHNRTNVGYLESCNNGIRLAKGRYLCLLNNDVNVLPSSFDALYKTFRHFPTAGLVGSKLTYPTGQLQEAGGIVWNDGSAWNVGRLRDANEPQFNYLRSVDYCSAASIMVARELLDNLGGFDEIYKPAYYEDADLAFGIRNLGFDVLYQPCSVVVHYEGISHGTNLSQGLKKHQLINAQTFYEKWQSQLKSHRPNGKDPDQEKDRGFQLRVLLVDKCTPSPDRDAGSVVLLNLMLLLRHLGYQPTFIPDDNYANLIPYTPLCQSLGIECIYAPYVTSVKQHLEQFGTRYDLVILFRPDLSQCHMPVVRRLCPNAKVIYYPHDLHYIRMEREANLYGKRSLRARALASKKIELDLSLQADSTIVVSITEKEELNNQLPTAQIDYLPLIVNESTQGGRAKYGGSDLVFVGNFNHSPNEDAVCWFAKDILPLIVKERPDTVFHVVGANPPSSVCKLTGPNMTVHGFVEDLDSLLSKMTLSVAPLRYGAGMKGKIVSAMRAGLPVVCTSIGSEGMQLDDRDHACIADDAASFADGVIQVLKSRVLWDQLSQSGVDLCAQRWGKNASIQGLQKILSQLGLPCSPKHKPESLMLYPFE